MATKSRRSRGHRGIEEVTGTAAAPVEADRPVAMTVDGRTAVRRIRECVAACASAEVRTGLHAVVRAAARGVRGHRRAAALEAAVDACLAEAVRAGQDRWSVDEAAAWGLARLVRSRRALVATGRLLEHLVAEARVGSTLLADRDTRPARFVIVLARLFADVEACRELEPIASAAVEEEIGRLVTADGAVVLSGSTAVIDRVDRWTAIRSALLGPGGRAWGDDAERRWLAAAAWALGLLGPRGRRPADGKPAPAGPLVAAVVDAAGRGARRTAKLLRRGATAHGRRGGLLPPDRHDAAAATAVIRSGWERDAVRVLVEWRDAAPRLEIAAGDRMLVDGSWEWSVALDGRPLEAEGPWSVSAWETDRKAAFLEIAAPLVGGMRLERQLAVLRRSRIVLLADAVVPTTAAHGTAAGGTGAGEISVRMAVPLAAALETELAAETREVLAYDGHMRFLALPPALPEWRTAGRGSLVTAEGRLVLEQSGHRRLYAPLWLDCDPRRIGRPLTWRQLTVADTRRNLPAHQAAGFRVQAGTEQWLLYRALDTPRNRTLLGCNVSSGFLLGRVKRSGEVARTIEIE